MNLFDIVNRKDRALKVEAGQVETTRGSGSRAFLGIALGAGARFRLLDAHDFTALHRYPRVPNWAVYAAGDPAQKPDLIVKLEASDGRSHLLYPSPGTLWPDNAISLDWPAWVGFAPGFDLVIENCGGTACELATTRLFNPRLNLRPLLQGDGIEVGPGTNPFVKADANTSVRYVEAAPIETWVSNYGKSLDAGNLKDLWASYIIGDAVTLDIISDGSLDFIFSSHVFEHLNNPIQVLENWSSKLKAGGFVVAVIPDLRYCFDLRQPPSDPSDWIEEYASQADELSLAKYEKWCRYTAPYATPDSLIERNYSIHAHYYTLDTIIELGEIVKKRGWYDRVFLNASPNNKDFGIALRRSAQ